MKIRLKFGWVITLAGMLTVPSAQAARELRESADANAELFAAIRQGSVADIRAALDRGASAKAMDQEGTPALVQAVIYCAGDAVKLLLDRGADPNAHAAQGAPALVLAAGDLAKVTALVEGGADIDGRSPMGRTALLTAAAQRDSYRVVKYLLDHGADPKILDQAPEFLGGGKNISALMLAVRSRDNRTVQMLLDRGLDVNAATTTGNTALTDAVSARNLEGLRMLIARGANVNVTYGPLKQTPLIWAAFQESPEIVTALLKAGADVNAKDAMGSTALVWAAMSERDDTATVEALLRAGAMVEVKTAMGETPMAWAQRRGKTAIVALIEGELKKREGKNEIE